MCAHVVQKPFCLAIVMQSTVLGLTQTGLPIMVPAQHCMEAVPWGLLWVILYRDVLAPPSLLLGADGNGNESDTALMICSHCFPVIVMYHLPGQFFVPSKAAE